MESQACAHSLEMLTAAGLSGPTAAFSGQVLQAFPGPSSQLSSLRPGEFRARPATSELGSAPLLGLGPAVGHMGSAAGCLWEVGAQ